MGFYKFLIDSQIVIILAMWLIAERKIKIPLERNSKTMTEKNLIEKGSQLRQLYKEIKERYLYFDDDYHDSDFIYKLAVPVKVRSKYQNTICTHEIDKFLAHEKICSIEDAKIIHRNLEYNAKYILNKENYKKTDEDCWLCDYQPQKLYRSNTGAKLCPIHDDFGFIYADWAK